MYSLSFKVFVILSFLKVTYGWENEQLEVFDIVDEVKENFYSFLNISNNASTADVRKAFKKLSIVWHPDKNLNEDTSEKFRNLVSVYEVLRDQKKRAYYDEVLITGLPNWKSAIFYYRSVRKMGFLEGFIIVFLIITVGQYLVAWAAYFEKKYTFEQVSIMKTRKQKKNAPPITFDTPKPSMLNTLPIQIPYLFYYIITSLPAFVIFIKESWVEMRTAAKEEEESSEEEEVVQKPKVRRRKPAFQIPEGPNFEVKQSNESEPRVEANVAPVSGGLWTDDDLSDLVHLVKKYPGGTPNRWEVIADNLFRSVPEVTYMANKLKSNGYRLPNAEEEEVVEEKVKVKTKGGKLNVEESVWTQAQQQSLEDALANYPKGSIERWERVAEAVPNKTKEDCMLRYKFLVESIKKQKDL